ncbi:hypothetical protein [Plantactinospora endophytica]|uniref:DUF3850 domain-containing protein n=1 Tax=Plantactinospora endophytica TaxID=673535 RepID=A0ABQ4E2F5_9ACTN|nr:hypothetical protein [Plantactinospora endophytica]GIG88882.1 hypothetical protein Pen02_38180 [Plantactinospora endophytica]
MSARRPDIRVGDILEVAEGDYCFGLGRLILEVIELGRRERHTDGLWLHLRGVELQPPDGVRLRQRRLLVRLDALAIRPGPLSRRHPPEQRADERHAPGQRSPEPFDGTTSPRRAHLPRRPDWTCAGCDEDWPCPDQQARFLIRYQHNRLALLSHLGRYAALAVAELPDLSPEELRSRFLDWAGGSG